MFEKASAGTLRFDELQKGWHSLDSIKTALDVLYADLEDAETHTPGFFSKEGVDHVAWEKQYEYQLILCDSLLLEHLRVFGFSKNTRYQEYICHLASEPAS